MHMHMQDHDKCQSYTFLTKRKVLPNIEGVCINRWQITLIPVVSSSDSTYETWLAYL
jgi:hypothetical protein